jgi:hypothetical protein
MMVACPEALFKLESGLFKNSLGLHGRHYLLGTERADLAPVNDHGFAAGLDDTLYFETKVIWFFNLE